MFRRIILIVAVLVVLAFFSGVGSWQNVQARPESQADVPQTGSSNLFLPLVLGPQEPMSTGLPPVNNRLRVNVPMTEEVSFENAAVFWFGQVSPNSNYVDGRMTFTPAALNLRLSVIDRYLWYDPEADLEDLNSWDSISLYLKDENGHGFRFSAQLSWWEERDAYQAAYIQTGSGWEFANIPFSTDTNWRGNAPNDDDGGDRGWVLTYTIPFAALGNVLPSEGTIWRMAIIVHDRDGDLQGEQLWPPAVDLHDPGTWGEIRFGLPAFSPPSFRPGGEVIIREGLNGVIVPDAGVGGGTVCGSGTDYWSEWPNISDPDSLGANIQNQGDIADWPCFSKYYLTFPLESLPEGKEILAATLTLHQFGNSGGGDWGPAPDSYLQVLTVASGWDETSLNWNNAPLAVENISSILVSGLNTFPDWPGVPRDWDVTRAVSAAYHSANPLRIAVYSADEDYHSGKYFSTSEAEDWNQAARPTLHVVWGNK